jgi:hypothetical protein
MTGIVPVYSDELFSYFIIKYVSVVGMHYCVNQCVYQRRHSLGTIPIQIKSGTKDITSALINFG